MKKYKKAHALDFFRMMYLPVRGVTILFNCEPLQLYRLPYVVLIFRLPERKMLRQWRYLAPRRNMLNLDKLPTYISMREEDYAAMIPGLPVMIDTGVQYFYDSTQSSNQVNP